MYISNKDELFVVFDKVLYKYSISDNYRFKNKVYLNDSCYIFDIVEI
jgi:hypothetical protein